MRRHPPWRRSVLPAAVALMATACLCTSAPADDFVTALIPVKYASVEDIARALTPPPDGILMLWAVKEHNLLVVRGDESAVEQLRVSLLQLDRPPQRLQMTVRLVLAPPPEDDAGPQDWWTNWPDPGQSGTQRVERGEFADRLTELYERGGRTSDPLGGPKWEVESDKPRVFWFDGLRAQALDADALALGIEIAPKANTDQTIGLALRWVQAMPDERSGISVVPLGLPDTKTSLALRDDLIIAAPRPRGRAIQIPLLMISVGLILAAAVAKDAAAMPPPAPPPTEPPSE